jgi:hypothetical protein
LEEGSRQPAGLEEEVEGARGVASPAEQQAHGWRARDGM